MVIVYENISIWRLVDNLPAATQAINPQTNELQLEHGYRLGEVIGDKSYINNHLKLTLLYHHPTRYIL